jgi:hypothetical protein
MTVAIKLAVVVVFVLGIVAMAALLDEPKSRGSERVPPPREVRPRLAPPRPPRADSSSRHGTPGMPADLRNQWRRQDERDGAA